MRKVWCDMDRVGCKVFIEQYSERESAEQTYANPQRGLTDCDLGVAIASVLGRVGVEPEDVLAHAVATLTEPDTDHPYREQVRAFISAAKSLLKASLVTVVSDSNGEGECVCPACQAARN